MRDELDIYRHQMVQVVLGTHPAMLEREADPVGLESLCRRLHDAACAIKLVRAHGYAWPDQSLTEIVCMLLNATTPPSFEGTTCPIQPATPAP